MTDTAERRITSAKLVTRFARGREALLSAGTSLALLILVLGVTACTPSRPSPEKAIVGKWVNPQGYAIFFYSDGTGFVPGVEGQVPPYKFTYSFKDETHIAINIVGQSEVVVEIKIQDDKMTWLSGYDNLDYVYTRVK